MLYVLGGKWYIVTSIMSYRETKTLFIKMNERYDIGQPKFSKEEQIVAITISVTSWIGWVSSASYHLLNYSNLKNEPAYEF